MNRFYVNLDYTTTPALLCEKLNVRGSKTLFLTFCMHVTGVYRLFDEQSVREFLYRLAIVFRHYNVVSKFFTNDTMVTFDDRGVRIEFCLDDIIQHLGFELWDGPTDMAERKDWIGKIETFWKNACKIAVFTNVPILDSRVIGKNKYIIGSNKPAPITPECEKNADLITQSAMNTIREQAFVELSKRVAERKVYLAKYQVYLESKPRLTYSFEKIPLKIKKKAFRKLYGPIFRNRDFFEEEVNEPKSTFAALIHLAWVWQNGYIITHKLCFGEGKCCYDAEVDERIDFDYELYDGLNKLGIGVNLYDTYHDYRLEEIAHLLKEK